MDYFNDVQLKPLFNEGGISFGELEGNFKNHYYVLSDPKIAKLLNSPEVVGFDVYKALLPATSAALRYFSEQHFLHPVNILTILRGALNYPMEESCYLQSIPVHDISFLSCERVFDGKEIVGLDARYSKLAVVPDGTLLMGDIIASGETLIYCLNHVLDFYKQHDARLKNILAFTIGGTRAVEIAEEMTEKIRCFWPEFEGFNVVFYGGMFSCYENAGVAGIQIKNIDFYWGEKGIVDPEYRRITLSQRDPIFEKCIIYDGGARRYEINEHIGEVLEYWEAVRERSGRIDILELLAERLGHPLKISLEEWIDANGYRYLEKDLCEKLYQQEQDYIRALKEEAPTLKKIAEGRIAEFKEALNTYVSVR
ncbi:MAG: hypothetical protein IJJ30_03315 [Erysipelotrichaceae bacterium]|nr:hypothetical protein [Erysipelotrichaceae bacterium]